MQFLTTVLKFNSDVNFFHFHLYFYSKTFTELRVSTVIYFCHMSESIYHTACEL